MRKHLLAAAAAAAIATPAAARDNSPYVGLDAGAILVEDADIDFDFDNGTDQDEFITVDHKYGYDVGLLAGYDFGGFRAEVEVARKRARHDDYQGGGVNSTFEGADGFSRSTSLMGNLLLDVGDEDGIQGSVGGGVGVARTRMRIDDPAFNGILKDTGFAWQVLAGVRAPVTPNVDLGVKYRFYNAKVDADFVIGRAVELASQFRSHSLLASLTFNLGAPPAPPVAEAAPPPPPPPPPPPTQTCPDGSVILATDACPAPPPPPPPPAPTVERG